MPVGVDQHATMLVGVAGVAREPEHVADAHAGNIGSYVVAVDCELDGEHGI